MSEEVLVEVDRNLRKKLPHVLRVYKELLVILRPALQASPSAAALQRVSGIVHPKDAAILAAALEANADYLVTLDRRHFGPAAPKVAGAIRIVTPGELLRELIAR